MKEENVKSEYQRKVDKSLIPTCNIMGVNIAAINMNWLYRRKTEYVFERNTHPAFLAQQEQLSEIDKKLQLVLEQLAVMNQNRYGRKTEQMQGAKALCGCIVPAGEKKKPSFSMNTRKQEKQTIRKSF